MFSHFAPSKLIRLRRTKIATCSLFLLFLSTVDVICLQKLVTVCRCLYFSLYTDPKNMEWSDKHDITLCREVSVMEPYQYPYRSKERGVLLKAGPRPATIRRPNGQAVRGPGRYGGPRLAMARRPVGPVLIFHSFLSSDKSTHMHRPASGLGVQNGRR